MSAGRPGTGCDRRVAGDGSRLRVAPAGPIAAVLVELYQDGASIDVMGRIDRGDVAGILEGAARALLAKAESLRK